MVLERQVVPVVELPILSLTVGVIHCSHINTDQGPFLNFSLMDFPLIEGEPVLGTLVLSGDLLRVVEIRHQIG